MNLSVYRMTLDIRDMDSQLSFSLKQNDTMRRLIISLTDHCKPYTIPEGCYAVFTIKTSQKTGEPFQMKRFPLFDIISYFLNV